MTLDTRTLARPVIAPVAGHWGRRHEVAAAGSAIVAEAARFEPTHHTSAHAEPGDYDPNWSRLLQTSQALDLLLGLGTARLAG